MKVSVPGLLASLGSMALASAFLSNPYAANPLAKSTIFIVIFMIILPACIGLAASILKKSTLMFMVGIWSFPYGLYLTVANIPSLWNGFGLALFLYFMSSIQMRSAQRVSQFE